MRKSTGHLQYDWWKYLLVILLPIFLWCSVFDVLAKPKENERLHILFLGDGLDAVALKQTLEEQLPALTDQKIKEVKVTTDYAAGELYGRKLTTYSYEFDLIIVPQSFMADNTGQFFRRLPMEGLPGYENAKLHWEEVEEGEYSAPFGFVLWEPGVENGFRQFYSGREICYIFFSTESVNLYPLFEGSAEGDNAAVVALDLLLKK